MYATNRTRHGQVYRRAPMVRSHPLNQGRIAWWLALPGLTGGAVWKDIAGDANGALNAFAGQPWAGTSRPGGFGQLASVNANSNYVSTSGLGVTTNTLTIHCWIYPTVFSSFHAMIESRQAGNFIGLLLSGAASTTVTSVWTGSATEYNASTGLVLTQNAWQFVACVVTPTVLTTYLVYNGSLSSFALTQTNPAQAIGSWYLLNDPGALSRAWDGSGDDFGVVNRAWTQSEVLAWYHESVRGYPGVLARRDDAMAAAMFSGAGGGGGVLGRSVLSGGGFGAGLFTGGRY